jgi:hypothetical protein
VWRANRSRSAYTAPGARCDVHIDGEVLRFWVGNELVKTAARTSTNAIRKKHASRTCDET